MTTVCLRGLDPFDIVTFYIKWVKRSGDILTYSLADHVGVQFGQYSRLSKHIPIRNRNFVQIGVLAVEEVGVRSPDPGGYVVFTFQNYSPNRLIIVSLYCSTDRK